MTVLFISLYALMCILWTIFCVRAQHAINGRFLVKDAWVIILNLLFAPISLIMGINRIPKDFHRTNNENKT